MACEIVKDERGVVTKIVCGRGKPRCRFCGRPSTKLCDFRLERGTCDAPMCAGCATHAEPDTDFCPNHKAGVK